MTPLDTEEDPQVLGPFELLAVIGQGGMGKVYLGRRLPLEHLDAEAEDGYLLPDLDNAEVDAEDALIAVKVIQPGLLKDDSADQEARTRARFVREVSATRAVVSDRVPAFQGADPEAARPWLAIDYVHGPDLRAVVRKRGTLSVGPFAALGLGMVEALRAIHEARLLHRDLKPSNVVLGPRGPVIVDFGLAVLAERRMSQAQTRTGLAFGTLGYMPWEQTRDFKRVGPEGDVYSLGATLFFAAAGRPPFTGLVMAGSPSWEGVDPAFLPLLARVLVHVPEKRPTLDELREGLLELLIEHGLSETDAERQLQKVVDAADLAPELPTGALEDRADSRVLDVAQAVVDAGDEPGETDSDLLWELLGDAEADLTQVRIADAQVDAEPLPPTLPFQPCSPTVRDPAARSIPAEHAARGDRVTSYRLAPPARTSPAPDPASAVTAPQPQAPPGALKAAERLRTAYARRSRF